MNTIEEEAEIYAKKLTELRIGGQSTSTMLSREDYKIEGFIAGAEFIQHWIPVEEDPPAIYKDVFLKNIHNGNIFVGFYGSKRKQPICRNTENVLFGITHWRPIERL